MTDAIHKLTAVRYLGDRLQMLAQELQGLGYSLASIDSKLRAPVGAYPAMKAIEFHHLAGQAARLQAQIERILQQTKQLMFEAEALTPKGQDS